MIFCRKAAIILTVVGSLSCRLAYAQTGHTFKQPAHTFLKDMSWRDSIYMFPDFRQGSITYFTGFTPERNLRLNYNLYFGQIDIIDAQGDTAQIAPSKTFKSVSVGNDQFLYDQKEGYLHVMIRDEITLVERTFFHLAKADYVSGGQIRGGNSADYDVRGRPSDYDRVFKQASFYYFVDKQGRFLKANRSSLKKLLPEYKSAIYEFARSHATNFAADNDVREITRFCNGLLK